MQRTARPMAIKITDNSLLSLNELRRLILTSFISGMAGGLFVFLLIASAE